MSGAIASIASIASIGARYWGPAIAAVGRYRSRYWGGAIGAGAAIGAPAIGPRYWGHLGPAIGAIGIGAIGAIHFAMVGAIGAIHFAIATALMGPSILLLRPPCDGCRINVLFAPLPLFTVLCWRISYGSTKSA